jgi:hypothetical protein
MIFNFGQFDIEITMEPYEHKYSELKPDTSTKEYVLVTEYSYSPHYRIVMKTYDVNQKSCLIQTDGCIIDVNSDSIVQNCDHLYIAIGREICCLNTNSLELIWHTEVDLCTCFGIHLLPDKTGIISHGEIDIARVSLNGDIEWRASGKDIFTEGFLLLADHIEVIDFNHDKYHIDISNGKISQLSVD